MDRGLSVAVGLERPHRRTEVDIGTKSIDRRKPANHFGGDFFDEKKNELKDFNSHLVR